MKIKNKFVTIIIAILMVEFILLGIETSFYLTNKSAHLTINGKIIAGVDDVTNFSKINK